VTSGVDTIGIEEKEVPVSRPTMRRTLFLGLTLAALSAAPAPPQTAPKASPLAEARYKAALRQFEEVWKYYRQSRTDSFMVYYWSRLVLESQQDLSDAKDDRIAALKAHDDRIKQLESLILRVRKLGFAFSTDVGATAYYRLEADRWLEKARAE
jgi:hypothetical protein